MDCATLNLFIINIYYIEQIIDIFNHKDNNM